MSRCEGIDISSDDDVGPPVAQVVQARDVEVTLQYDELPPDQAEEISPRPLSCRVWILRPRHDGSVEYQAAEVLRVCCLGLVGLWKYRANCVIRASWCR